jgi:hypothetical protein
VQLSGATVRVQTTTGEEIATLTPSRNYQFVVVSTPQLTTGTAYGRSRRRLEDRDGDGNDHQHEHRRDADTRTLTE